MLVQLLVVLNSLILPFFYTSIKQILYQQTQYGNDLQRMMGDSIETARIKTGQEYQSNKNFITYLFIVMSIIIAQFIYLQYIIIKSFRPDKFWLLLVAGLCVVLAGLLPILLIFCYFYEVDYIGHLLLDKTYSDSIIDFLKVNPNSIFSWFSGCFLLSNILYLLVFNRVHYICISKVT